MLTNINLSDVCDRATRKIAKEDMKCPLSELLGQNDSERGVISSKHHKTATNANSRGIHRYFSLSKKAGMPECKYIDSLLGWSSSSLVLFLFLTCTEKWWWQKNGHPASSNYNDQGFYFIMHYKRMLQFYMVQMNRLNLNLDSFQYCSHWTRFISILLFTQNAQNKSE